MKFKLAVFGLLTAALLAGCSNGTSKNPENTSNIYKAKITNVSQDDNGDWVIKGVSGAPDGSKVLISNYNEDSLNYRENGSESLSRASFSKVKNKKFQCLVSPIMICDSDQEKEGQKIKVLSFAITNYHKKWTTSEIPLRAINTAKKHIKSQTLTISKSQEDYYNSLDSKANQSNQSKNNAETSKPDNNTSEIVPTSDYPDISTTFDTSNMSQYSDDNLFKSVTLQNFYVKDIGSDKLDNYHLLLSPSENSQQLFLIVTDKLKDKVKLGDKISAQATLNGKSKITQSQINSGFSYNYLNKPVILVEVDKVQINK